MPVWTQNLKITYMDAFKLMAPEPGNSLEVEGVLNPA
ncbi:MAG: hypothetical protein JWR54_135, partial [Mucilaginibacter sp.]|nr:hypothetical protein [Mucilaginibacter sp.]